MFLVLIELHAYYKGLLIHCKLPWVFRCISSVGRSNSLQFYVRLSVCAYLLSTSQPLRNKIIIFSSLALGFIANTESQAKSYHCLSIFILLFFFFWSFLIVKNSIRVGLILKTREKPKITSTFLNRYTAIYFLVGNV